MLTALIVVAALQSREPILGVPYADVLKMGEARWTALYAKKQGDSTIAISGGFSSYGAALAWRNDRLLKGKNPPLRDHLQAFTDHAQEVGAVATGKGTIWTIFAGQGYRDTEKTLYQVLSHSYRGPSRKTSEVERSVARLAGVGTRSADAKSREEARLEVAMVRREMASLFALARRMPRRDSDAVLEFARSTAQAVVDQAQPL